MLTIRKSRERGYFDHGWLKTFHTFSFADYFDPSQMGFRHLRVLNQDWVAPGRGFGAHPHRDMEIISYVLAGAMEHRDSLGNGSVIQTGDVQRMSAGTGVVHSEYNHSRTVPLRFLQIWLMPWQRGLKPSYKQQHFDEAAKRDHLCLLVAPEGEDEAVSIHQRVRIYTSILSPGTQIPYALAPDHGAWLQVLRGEMTCNGEPLLEGDGAALEAVEGLVLKGTTEAEFLLLDLQ